jgi:cytoskeletal protein RodZ
MPVPTFFNRKPQVAVAIDLKQEREKKKISLAQIASDTRISLRYLENIESGRYGDLPGGVYNRAFIKAYCESIKIDPSEILEQYDAQVLSSAPEKTPKTVLAVPSQSSFFMPVPVLIWSVMLLVSAVGLFFSRHWIAELFSPYFTEKPAANVNYPHPPEPQTDSQPDLSKALSAADSESSGETGALSDNAAKAPAAEEPPEENRASSLNEPIQSEAPADTKLRVQIVSKDPCWISVDVDGRPSSRRLMEPGEELVFNAAERLFILIGNAGGVQLKINGKTAKPLGEPGEVIKMNIDLKNMQQFLDESAG